MPNFDFTNLADLELNALKMQATNEIYEKQKVNQSFWQESPQLFVENYIRCLFSAVPCGAVASVVAAQGILESGWFSTNSLFGVKATRLQTQAGLATPIQTHEVVGGLSIPTVGNFFVTPSIQNCFANYYSYALRMKPNSSSFLPADAIGYLNYLQSPLAYSTAGEAYVMSIMDVIQSNGLTAFDHP